MFPAHDPYFHLIKSVANINGCKLSLIRDNQNFSTHSICDKCNSSDQKSLQYFLTGLILEKQDLINRMGDSYVNVMYEDRYIRAAYMLLYFPFYIEPIYYVIKPYFRNIVKPNVSELKVCFIGGGPLPELLGLGKVISTINFIKKINCTVLDIFPHWTTERVCCTKPMLDEDYFGGECIIHHEKFDLWNENMIVPDIIREADLVISQNCINDCPREAENILNNNFRRIWKNLKTGSSLVVIDLYYSSVKNLLLNLQGIVEMEKDKVVQNVKHSEIIRNNPNGLDFSFKKCNHIEELLGQSKPHVKFYNVIFRKSN